MRGAKARASDHDARIAEVAKRIAAPPPEIAPDDILRFPRGPSAGECLHAIFERIDFTDPAGWNDGIARGLDAHPQFLPGVRAAEQSPLLASMASRMLANVMSTTLPDGIVLGSHPHRPAPHRARIQPAVAARVGAARSTPRCKSLGYDVPRLTFRDLEGYLKGFIDLVFEHGGRYYVLDWKSNHLGYAPSDYGPAELQAAMTEHSYHLQYLLYSLAVDRYLQHRVPRLPPRHALRRRALPLRARRAAGLDQCRRHAGGRVPPSAVGGDARAARRAVRLRANAKVAP